MVPVQHMFPRTILQTSHAAALSPANAGLTADLAAVERAGRSGRRSDWCEVARSV